MKLFVAAALLFACVLLLKGLAKKEPIPFANLTFEQRFNGHHGGNISESDWNRLVEHYK